MKLTAIILNLVLVATTIYLLISKGVPDNEGLFFVSLLLSAPTTSLIALLLSDRESWLGLYFKRKALEEKKKIESLGGAK